MKNFLFPLIIIMLAPTSLNAEGNANTIENMIVGVFEFGCLDPDYNFLTKELKPFLRVSRRLDEDQSNAYIGSSAIYGSAWDFSTGPVNLVGGTYVIGQTGRMLIGECSIAMLPPIDPKKLVVAFHSHFSTSETLSDELDGNFQTVTKSYGEWQIELVADIVNLNSSIMTSSRIVAVPPVTSSNE